MSFFDARRPSPSRRRRMPQQAGHDRPSFAPTPQPVVRRPPARRSVAGRLLMTGPVQSYVGGAGALFNCFACCRAECTRVGVEKKHGRGEFISSSASSIDGD